MLKNYLKSQQIHRAGEVILKPVDTLPEKSSLKDVTNSAIIAHSETGHHHVLETKVKNKVKIYTTLDGETFVALENIGELTHKKTGKDVHTTHKVAPGIYKIILKKEFDYFQGILRVVRD